MYRRGIYYFELTAGEYREVKKSDFAEIVLIDTMLTFY